MEKYLLKKNLFIAYAYVLTEYWKNANAFIVKFVNTNLKQVRVKHQCKKSNKEEKLGK